MLQTPSLRPAGPLQKTPLARFQRWWRRLTPQRQDRFAVLAPLAAVLLFLAAIVAAFAYLRLEEIEREQEAVRRDVEYTQQQLRLRLLERQEQLMRLGSEISNREVDADEFEVRAEAMVARYPELQGLSWIDERRRIKSSVGTARLSAVQLRTAPSPLKTGDTDSAFSQARELQQPFYAQRAESAEGRPCCNCTCRSVTARAFSACWWRTTRWTAFTATACPPRYQRATPSPSTTPRARCWPAPTSRHAIRPPD